MRHYPPLTIDIVLFSSQDIVAASLSNDGGKEDIFA